MTRERRDGATSDSESSGFRKAGEKLLGKIMFMNIN